MAVRGVVKPTERSIVDYERQLAVGVGQVLEQQLARRSPGLRGPPSVVTDAPIHSGMSGGPVLDAPGGPGQRWNSYVALCAPVLELSVMARSTAEAATSNNIGSARCSRRTAVFRLRRFGRRGEHRQGRLRNSRSAMTSCHKRILDLLAVGR